MDKENKNDKKEDIKKDKINTETPIKSVKMKKEKKPKEKNTATNSKRKKIFKIIRIVILIFFLLILIAGGILIATILSNEEFKMSKEALVVAYSNSVIKDIDGNIITEVSGDEKRKVISISEMSKYLPDAFVAIEDERFKEHNGVDLKRTARATLTYIFNGGRSSFGGSTITQQLVKNITHDTDNSSLEGALRKIKEMSKAYSIENILSKTQILELYLNILFVGGSNYHGVELGANYYFNKSAKDLDLAESAFLAGINHSPNAYKPFSEENKDEMMEKINKRTKTVLNKMKELGYMITEEEYNTAIEKINNGLTFEKGKVGNTVYSDLTELAIKQVINDLVENKGYSKNQAETYVYGGGLTINTTQKTSIQTRLEEEMKKTTYSKKSRKTKNEETGEYITSQAAMTIIDNKTGYVVGTVGALGEKSSIGNLIRTMSLRPTGSAMKPLAVIAPAVEKRIITAGSVYDDIPLKSGAKVLKNYYSGYKGLSTVRAAIEISQNIVPVQIIRKIGYKDSIDFMRLMGISSLVTKDENAKTNDEGDSLALGGLTYGISPLEMAAGYAMIANDGEYITPTFYTTVIDTDGNIILEAKQEKTKVMSKESAYIVKSILTQPVIGSAGTATYCKISGMDVCAKTGTTSDDKDRWLCGFTPYYSGAAWYGFDKPETVYFSGNPAGKIWDAVMTDIHKELKGQKFVKPDNIISTTICRSSGLLPTELCANAINGNCLYTENFIKGTVPTKKCETHVLAQVCGNPETGYLLCNEYCLEKQEIAFITRANADVDTSWKSAGDAKFMLPTETCTIHTKPIDTVKPQISLIGDISKTIYLNEKYIELGAKAEDETDGDITSKIVISGIVDTSKEGTYPVTYTVKDTSGNEAFTIRTITVKKINKPEPEITLKGKATVELNLNATYIEEGATAIDEIDGIITSKIVISEETKVNTSVAGTYYIKYTVTNSKGKTATKTRTIIVKKPEILNTVNNTIPTTAKPVNTVGNTTGNTLGNTVGNTIGNTVGNVLIP